MTETNKATEMITQKLLHEDNVVGKNNQFSLKFNLLNKTKLLFKLFNYYINFKPMEVRILFGKVR